MRSGNMGLSMAQGNYLMFLDYDDLLFADHVETLLEKLLMSPDVSACVSASWRIYTEYKTSGYEEKGYIAFNKSLTKVSYEAMCRVNQFPIQACLFSKKLFLKYGGFDETLLGLEDWDLWLRYTRNESFAYTPKTTSLFRVRNISYHNIDKTIRQQQSMQMIKAKMQQELSTTAD